MRLTRSVAVCKGICYSYSALSLFSQMKTHKDMENPASTVPNQESCLPRKNISLGAKTKVFPERPRWSRSPEPGPEPI